MVVGSYLVHYDALLQNATDIIRKRHKILLQIASTFHYKMRILLQNAAVDTKFEKVFTKCEKYYKMRRLLQNKSVQTSIQVGSRGEAVVHIIGIQQLITSCEHFKIQNLI